MVFTCGRRATLSGERHTRASKKAINIMKSYESPAVIELGSVSDLTRGTGDEHDWDSDYGLLKGLGFILGNGGEPSGSNG